VITLSFPTSYLPVLIICLIAITTGFNALSEPIANVLKRKPQSVSDVMASVVVGLLFLVVGVVALVITWPE
jgi:multisubunit Na+/H+ antiporter MnhB subunit